MKPKAIGYVRVSTDKQADRGVSLEAQVEKIRAMATVHDVELLDVIVDAGESAKDLDRPSRGGGPPGVPAGGMVGGSCTANMLPPASASCGYRIIQIQLWASRIWLAETTTQRPASRAAGAWQSHNLNRGTKAVASENPYMSTGTSWRLCCRANRSTSGSAWFQSRFESLTSQYAGCPATNGLI